MFEAIYELLNNFNILGNGIFIVICGLIFAIINGISRNREQMILYGIMFGAFSTVILFKADFIKGLMFLTTSVLIIIYSLVFLGKEWRSDEK